MRLHDAVDAPRRVVLAHGFTQTARSWATVERGLRERLAGIETFAVDLPGHGDAAPPADVDLWGSADVLVRTGGLGTYIGYSMGGRVALHAALAHPDQVQRLVLVGATAGLDDPDEREARRTADERLADHIEVVGVQTFIDEWLENPLFEGLTDETAQRRPAAEHRRGSRHQPPIDRHGNAGAAVGTARWHPLPDARARW